MKKILSSVAVAGLLVGTVATTALAIGGPSGAHIDYAIPGQLGEVVVNPYDTAPLTAVIKNGGYTIKDAKVTVVPKPGGQVISYKVADKHLRTHGGIPVFGMYPDYQNTIEVEYTKIYKGVEEKIKETYKIYAPAIYLESTGMPNQKGALFDKIEVVKPASKKFENRLYYVNNFVNKTGKGTKVVWNNPAGGAIEWNYSPNNFILDTKGEVRWYLEPSKIYDLKQPFNAGVMMGFKQNPDGAMTWGYGQHYAKYDILGREIFNRELPAGYNDFSHSMDVMDNGHYLLRVANANYKRADGRNVRTVRDVIVEVDRDGNVVDDWRLYEILDPYRDTVLKVLDQGAVCLNIDASKAGHTASTDELMSMDKEEKWGDIVGSGPGRNWAHVNSVDHDPTDDSIIISSRHQNAVIKIGRDKKVKWIMGGHKGWKEQFKSALLQPIDKNGNKIVCEDDYTKCPGYESDKGGFDWQYTQHTAFRIDSKSKKGVVYLTVFDNGDSRGFEQPAIAGMKYSRAVVFKIDEKAKTVEQVWEYGKERGSEWYSSVTSLTQYQDDLDSVFAYSAVAGMQFDIATGRPVGQPSPHINEFEWGAKEPSIEIKMTNAMGYQAFPFSVEKAFTK
ncbi:aryl-sulfate sulfotransferase [Campylobacter sp. RM9344]|uniref:Aryl-sulfate sulfotransferase n=1 Tax=Campylobacter californiensis TaxID=1032243 RepID=A0AAW3ZY82_9BACT|nr:MULTISPECIES: aryl-sulfate sulfotransferase [unclassified Campylobacter]MBE2985026.1 aryl-sulfate sulfotransferase [Campylobacter sp. RM6883]MBE2995222.1 aryl-sulfate sulfotransferase [Campylobacter sp. RM6913]MBE3029521.1 aryl-sulfate sulfotransferase [Campylobacter sp. RM9344]MBE3608215.1 aryl-sulfate sulfotransferase [Campylobacter sp. RM9337]QCD51618.1 arylsulfate sulfotransferase [Campylobacter sp. RM6914]